MDWPLYERIVTQLFAPLQDGDGIPDDELDATEARLGGALPRVLRQLYHLCGRRGDLHRVCEDLILPPALVLRDGWLGFYQNTLQQSTWAVAWGQGDDPPVFRQQGGTWVPDYPRLSEFLLAMLFWQAMNGGTDYLAQGTVPAIALDAHPQSYERLSLGGDWALMALWSGPTALVYSLRDSSEPRHAYCVYHDAGRLGQIAEHFHGASWETHGRRKVQVRPRNVDLSNRCAGCGRSKLTWADTSRGICARCGHPL
jgi:hypothetical protein